MHRTAEIFRTCSVQGKVSIYIIFSGGCQKSIRCKCNFKFCLQILNGEIARVTPIFKSGEETFLNNYRDQYRCCRDFLKSSSALCTTDYIHFKMKITFFTKNSLDSKQPFLRFLLTYPKQLIMISS